MTSESLPAIPVFRPDMSQAEIDAVAATLRSGWIGAGPRAAEFEQRFAERVGAAHAVSVSSGTAALQGALYALGVGPGDEVILPAFTWVSAFQAIRCLGATPVFADIEPEYLTMDPVDAARRVTTRTRGLIVVHHGGQLADISALQRLARRNGLWLLDDAAHACGATYQGRPVGCLGDVTCFSFNAMKNLATGDGGMVTTAERDIAEKVRRYRNLGIDRDTYSRYGLEPARSRWEYDVVSDGLRLALNDIAASIGLVQLRRIDELNGRRAMLVERYARAFKEQPALRLVQPRPGTGPSHHMLTALVAQRDALIEGLRARRISAGVHYIPAHLFTAARDWHCALPVTDRLWRQVVTLPLYPSMTPQEQDRVIAGVREVLATAAGPALAQGVPAS